MLDLPNSLCTVIMAAGKGTRMKSDLPKVLHKLHNKTLIAHVIQSALDLQSQDHDIIVVVGHQREKVMDSILEDFPKNQGQIHFVTQNPQLGTAHAVQQAVPLIQELNKEYVLVLSGDVPLIQSKTLRKLLPSERTSKPTMLGTVAYANTDTPYGLGRLIRDSETQNLTSMIEQKDIPSNRKDLEDIKEINTGIYLFYAQSLMEKLPLVQNNNNQKEYYLPDVIKMLIPQVNLVEIPFTEAMGINTPQQLSEASDVYLKIATSKICPN